MSAIIEIGYLLSTLSFLGGLKFMSSPKRAKTGNIIAASGMIFALLLTLFGAFNQSLPSINILLIAVTLIVGSLLGKRLSSKVEMTQMPQLVSLFNATGGGCAMLLGIVEGHRLLASDTDIPLQLLLIIGLFTGAVAFTGSILANRKLSGKTKDNKSKLVVFSARTLLILIISVIALYNLQLLPIDFTIYMYIVAALSLLYGILFVLPIGGADMPVVISLLNAITGIATALSGFVYDNKVMIAGGIFVGAAGILLTLLMCRAMNRSLFKVLAGTFKKGSVTGNESEQIIQEISLSETAMQLSYAKKIAIIPGYGLAVAQAQHECAQLQHILENLEAEVHYIIHPVAGRMPGHMNVLLAEANVDYDNLKEMDEVNDTMESYDLVMVIGANDVVNPAAEVNTDSSIYGMPIIRAYKSKKVVVLKRGMNKGYAGVVNELFDMENCHLLFGDAKESLQEITKQLKLI